MKDSRFISFVLYLILLGFGHQATCDAGPFEAGKFKGRIAWSADGNDNDPDDWIASPIAMAIFAEAGYKNRLAHFDYNSIVSLSDPDWEKAHADSVTGAIAHYAYDSARFLDCRKGLDAAITNLTKAINKSSATDPLYLIIAGPMDVPVRALQKAEPAKRPFVYCISHSRWNDGYDSNYKFKYTKRDVIELDVHWTQLPDQNQRLSFGAYGRSASPAEFAPYFWLRDSHDETLRFLWERMVASTRPDPSDAGMAWFIMTGDEECDPGKIRGLLEDHQLPKPVTGRAKVRLEAENFRYLDDFVVDEREDRDVSHRLSVRMVEGSKIARLRTLFNEPYVSAAARYDVEVRYLNEQSGNGQLAFLVNGQPHETAWASTGTAKDWTSHILRDVELRIDDEISLEVKGASCRIDYVQLNRR